MYIIISRDRETSFHILNPILPLNFPYHTGTYGVGGLGGALGATSFSMGLRGMIFFGGGEGGGEVVGGGEGEGGGLSGALRVDWSRLISPSS